ncbi:MULTISPECIES: hypothetical protein [unclassified Microcoleus]|uniref:hypothetical protein n=1 Tax=unclassified Microcoleus TaxID=2642155 RepID=UPI002FD14AA8
MSNTFRKLVNQSRRITRDEFAISFGGIADDVVEMLDSEQARQVVREAREIMESVEPLPNGRQRLRQVDFGLFSTAVELERGEVAAVDGTNTLPMQMYSAGQALSVGVGSISYRRPLQESLHYWSSKIELSESENTDDFIKIEEEGLYGISQTAYLRYYEVLHGLEIAEPYIFFDGTLVYEWLGATQEGVQLYSRLFTSGKKCLGVIKNVKANPVFAKFARALRQGELYIVETLADHLNQSNVPNKNQGEARNRYVLEEFKNGTASHILRGLFKPRKKAFGFEVHEDHLEDMLRIMAADCQLNNVGHEIPFLLNRIDEEVRKNFNPRIIQDRIAVRMATQSEELFFEETNERSFR